MTDSHKIVITSGKEGRVMGKRHSRLGKLGFKLDDVYNGISCIIPLHTLHIPLTDFDLFNIIYNKN